MTHIVHDSLTTLNCRTVVEIQRKVVKKWKQDTFPKIVHTKKDKGEIATWRADSDRTFHDFNVRSVSSLWQLLIAPLQVEIAGDVHVVVLSIHYYALVGQDGTNCRHHSVSATFYS